METGMLHPSVPAVAAVALQTGLPEFVPDLVGLAGTVVLVLVLVALAGFAYRMLTGGVEWPADESDDEALTRSDEDDWKYD